METFNHIDILVKSIEVKANMYGLYDILEGLEDQISDIKSQLEKFKCEMERVLEEHDYPLITQMQEEVFALVSYFRRSEVFNRIAFYCAESEAKIVQKYLPRKSKNSTKSRLHQTDLKNEEINKLTEKFLEANYKKLLDETTRTIKTKAWEKYEKKLEAMEESKISETKEYYKQKIQKAKDKKAAIIEQLQQELEEQKGKYEELQNNYEELMNKYKEVKREKKDMKKEYEEEEVRVREEEKTKGKQKVKEVKKEYEDKILGVQKVNGGGKADQCDGSKLGEGVGWVWF